MVAMASALPLSSLRRTAAFGSLQQLFRCDTEPLNRFGNPRPFLREKLLAFALQQPIARAGSDEHAKASLRLDQFLVDQFLITLQNCERIDPIFGRDIAHRRQRRLLDREHDGAGDHLERQPELVAGAYATSPPSSATASERLKPIQPRALSTTFAPRSASMTAVTYPAARDGDDDDLVFDPVHEVLPSLPPWEPLQSATVTRKKVAGMEVASLLGLLFWLANNSSSSLCRSAARPFFSAASNAFMVGPQYFLNSTT